MSDCFRYDHFNSFDAPVAVLSREGRIIYRNRAALSLSRKFALNGNFLNCFSNGENRALVCIERGKPLIAEINLGGGNKHTALLLPDRSPEGTAAMLVLAPLLEGDLCYEPSAAAFSSQPLMPGTAAIPNGKVLSDLGLVLINSYASALSSVVPLSREHFTMGHACMFLNRLYGKIFGYRSYDAQAKCTAECVDMPVENFARLFPVLSCLSVILTVNAEDLCLNVILSCQSERPVISFYFSPGRAYALGDIKELSELLPGRKIELSVLSAVLDRLGWEIFASVQEKKVCVEIRGCMRFPAHFFKSPDEQRDHRAAEEIGRFLALLTEPFEE